MSARQTITQEGIEACCADVCELANYSGEALFSIDQAQLNRIQLAGLQKRFAELYSRLPPVGRLADENSISAINTIHEIVPLLFPHTEYKSYPLALIDNCRFDQLNEWLNDYTVHDLTQLNVSHCQSLDEWLNVVEAHTSVRVVTSSGTSGKISLLPRSAVEDRCFLAEYGIAYGNYPNERGISEPYGPNAYHVSLSPRHGRMSMSRSADVRIRHGFGGDERHVLTLDGELSTDLLWITGRMKKAQADGKVEQLKSTKAWRRLSVKFAEIEARRAQSYDEFYKRVLVELSDKTVLMAAGFVFYWSMMRCAQENGLEIRFAPNSCLMTAGGLKGRGDLSDEQIETIKRTFPCSFGEFYGCSELMALARKCSFGHFHMPPSIVSFVLNPDTGAPLPREGVQTGRYAAFDLWAQTYWGGIITGDEVTICWDGDCSCGRKGAFLFSDIGRYADKRGGDDKITCQRTAAAVEDMMKSLKSDTP